MTISFRSGGCIRIRCSGFVSWLLILLPDDVAFENREDAVACQWAFRDGRQKLQLWILRHCAALWCWWQSSGSVCSFMFSLLFGWLQNSRRCCSRCWYLMCWMTRNPKLLWEWIPLNWYVSANSRVSQSPRRPPASWKRCCLLLRTHNI